MLRQLALAVVVAAAAACTGRPPIDRPIGGEGEGEGEGEGDGGDVDSVLVQAEAFCVGICAIEVDATLRFVATPLDAAGNPLPERPTTWSIELPEVASIDDAGVVTGIAPGITRIFAEVDGVVGEGAVEVLGPRPARVVVEPAELDLADGASAPLTVTVFDEDDLEIPDAPLLFLSGDDAVAVVDAAGNVTGAGPGGTVIYVEAGFAVFGAATVRVTSSDPVPAPLAVASFSAGVHHTCTVDAAGAGRCFGDNFFGQLGNGTQSPPGTVNGTPGDVVGSHVWSAIDAGQYISCGIDEVGAAWCWGTNDSGQLGGDDGGAGGSASPIAVSGGHVFVDVSAGGSHACGIDEVGAAWCWGANFSGQLGDGTQENRAAPVEVAGDQVWIDVVTGLFSTCALDDAGQAWCWGDSLNNVLGNGLAGDGTPQPSPGPVDTDERFSDIALTGTHVCALTSSAPAGRVLCWGDNSFGQLGDGTAEPRLAPVELASAAIFVALGVGAHHSCAADVDGAVSCWGNNDFAYLGDGTLESSLAPVAIAADAALDFVGVDGGPNHSCALSSTSELWCWGSGATGELGNGRAVGFGAFPVRVIAP